MTELRTKDLGTDRKIHKKGGYVRVTYTDQRYIKLRLAPREM